MITWSKSVSCLSRLVSLEMEPGPQAKEMRESWLELDRAVQLLECHLEFVQLPVGLRQVDVGLIGLRLERDGRPQVGNGILVPLLPDPENSTIDVEYVTSVAIERKLQGLLEISLRAGPGL